MVNAQTNMIPLGGSQLSTTAEDTTSADESMMDMRLSQPGLTMNGMICSFGSNRNCCCLGFTDEEMFEIVLDEDPEESDFEEHNNKHPQKDKKDNNNNKGHHKCYLLDELNKNELEGAAESSSIMIDVLQRELGIK